MQTVFDEEKKRIRLLKPQAFDPKSIFDCGQCFRFNEIEDGSFEGIAKGKVIRVSKIDDDIVIDNAVKEDYVEIWHEYFDMETDYVGIMESFSARDEVLKSAIEYGNGIRILKQDKWESLVSFIISQNNHIPRIKKCIENLSAMFGCEIKDVPVEFGNDGRKFFAFPSYETLADLTEKDLEPIKLGYRAGYIIDTAKAIAEDGGESFEKSGTLSNKELMEYLLGLKGVGPKVANCIMLFGYGRMDSFPIDVWIRRVMNRLYGIGENDLKEMNRFAEKTFGEYGGIAQQYLFYYIKNLN